MTTTTSMLSIEQLKPFGVKLTNVNLDSPEQREQISNALYENGVIIIPAVGGSADSQPIHTEERLLQLADLWGKIENYHPVNKSKDSADHIQILETMGKSNIPADSFLFHSDMSWRVNPSLASVLCARILPSQGGNTRFQNANLMYQNLSQELKEQLYSLSGVHSLKEDYARVNRPDDVENDIESIHPAVIKHPVSGVPLLYLNENFTVGLVGISEEESTALLKRVFEEATVEEQILSHTWTVGDIVIWDNLGVQHSALADYDELRQMHRIVIHNSTLRTERYLEDRSVEKGKNNIEYYLKREDNRQGYNEWWSYYEHDSNQAGYTIPSLATNFLVKYLQLKENGQMPRILDVAAGTGQNALHLMQNHDLTNIEAMDYSTNMLFEAQRRKLYREYHINDANQPWTLPSSQYDAVICVGGLAPNQIRPQPALEESIRVTKNGGLVLLSMREADSDYINEIHRLVEMGLAKILEKYPFVGIQSNAKIRHCIFVLEVCGKN